MPGNLERVQAGVKDYHAGDMLSAARLRDELVELRRERATKVSQ